MDYIYYLFVHAYSLQWNIISNKQIITDYDYHPSASYCSAILYFFYACYTVGLFFWFLSLKFFILRTSVKEIWKYDEWLTWIRLPNRFGLKTHPKRDKSHIQLLSTGILIELLITMRRKRSMAKSQWDRIEEHWNALSKSKLLNHRRAW